MRLAWPLLAVLFGALVAACDPSPDDPFIASDDDDDDPVPALVSDCAALAGTWQARELRLTSIANPEVIAAFDSDLTDFRVTFTNTIFSSRFDRPGIEPFAQTGRYDVLGDEIDFEDVPLMPGLSAGDNRFECRITDQDTLFLVGTGVSFDFASSGELQPALFEAELEPL